MTTMLPSLINGRWVRGAGEGAALIDPTLGTEIARVSAEGIDLGAALDFGRRRGGPALRAMTFASRGRLLSAIAARLAARRDAWTRTLLVNMGAPARDAAMDVEGSIQTLRYYASLGERLGETTGLIEAGQEQLSRAAGFQGGHIWTPIGGIAIHINAFNFPAWGLWEKAAVALLSGVPVIAKPAVATAMVAWEMVREVAPILPEGALSLLLGSGQGLVEAALPQDAVAFTGSAATAGLLRRMQNVSAGGIRLNVEADSLNSLILGPDIACGDPLFANFCDEAAREITIKSGQKCTAVRRILVPRALADAVCEEVAGRLAKIRTGDPRDAGVGVGPLVNKAQQRDVLQGIEDLKRETRTVHVGATDHLDSGDNRACFVPPHLLFCPDPADADAVHHREVFGPSATVLAYRDRDEAVALANRGGGSLVGSLFSNDGGVAAGMAAGLGPWHGRLLVVDEAAMPIHMGHGLVLPQSNHGGPGRAGGGEELGGLRGMRLYHQRSALQGSTGFLERVRAASAEALL